MLVLFGSLCLVLVESFSFTHTYLDMLYHRFIFKKVKKLDFENKDGSTFITQKLNLHI